MKSTLLTLVAAMMFVFGATGPAQNPLAANVAIASTCEECNAEGHHKCGWCGGDGIRNGAQCTFCNGRGWL